LLKQQGGGSTSFRESSMELDGNVEKRENPLATIRPKPLNWLVGSFDRRPIDLV